MSAVDSIEIVVGWAAQGEKTAAWQNAQVASS
jgi:hypothetical protein